MTAKIKQIHKDSKEIYGAPKITKILQEEGEKVSEKYIGNIMRENNMKAHYVKPYTITTKDCDFSNKLRNILKRDFNPTAPNEAWCTDITYIWTYDDGFVFKKNNSVDIKSNIGSIRGIKMLRNSKETKETG